MWECQRCGNLVSPSNREGSCQRALRRAAKIRGYCGGSADLSLPFPPRPWNMAQTTYETLRREAEALEAIPPEAWLAGDRSVARGIRRDPNKLRWWPGRDQRKKKPNKNKD